MVWSRQSIVWRVLWRWPGVVLCVLGQMLAGLGVLWITRSRSAAVAFVTRCFDCVDQREIVIDRLEFRRISGGVDIIEAAFEYPRSPRKDDRSDTGPKGGEGVSS